MRAVFIVVIEEVKPRVWCLFGVVGYLNRDMDR